MRYLRGLSGEPIYPGHGYPPNPGEDRLGLSPFGRLARGLTTGKSSILVFDPGARNQSPVDLVTIAGDNLDATQLVVTLHPPRVISLPFAFVQQADQQNLTGEQNNGEVSPDDFPGTTRSVQWPPLEARIEFGIGGVGSEVVVDYVNGTTVAVEASFLRVRAVVTQDRVDRTGLGTSAAYWLAAHVGPGFAQSRAQRTIYVGQVDSRSESDVLDVPLFARTAVLVGTRRGRHPPEPTSGVVRFFQSPDGTNGVADFFAGPRERRVEVPNGGLYFSVFNRSRHAQEMVVVFELAL